VRRTVAPLGWCEVATSEARPYTGSYWRPPCSGPASCGVTGNGSKKLAKFAAGGINVTRWRILAVLAIGDGVTISKIIDRAMMQQSALSRALMNMESEGFVRRGPRRGDARYVEVFLTNKGRGLFGALNVVVRRRQSRLLQGMSRAEVTAAFALIRRLIRNMVD
jgi:DNA-binding MarR family transcriptional regulator